MDIATALRKSIDDATPRTREVFGGLKAMSVRDIEAFITEYPVALISTVDSRGAPHVTGKAAVFFDGKVYFDVPSDTAMGRNLRRNPDVAVAFAEPPWKRHVFIYGTVRFLEEGGDEERRVMSAHRDAHGYVSPGLAEVLPRKVFTWKD